MWAGETDGPSMFSKELVKAKQNPAPPFHKHDNFLQYPDHYHQFHLQNNYDFGQWVYFIILNQISD